MLVLVLVSCNGVGDCVSVSVGDEVGGHVVF